MNLYKMKIYTTHNHSHRTEDRKYKIPPTNANFFSCFDISITKLPHTQHVQFVFIDMNYDFVYIFFYT